MELREQLSTSALSADEVNMFVPSLGRPAENSKSLRHFVVHPQTTTTNKATPEICEQRLVRFLKSNNDK